MYLAVKFCFLNHIIHCISFPTEKNSQSNYYVAIIVEWMYASCHWIHSKT